MILKKEQDDMYLFELDRRCAFPVGASKVLLDAELGYNDASYFRWSRTFYNDDPNDICVEVGQGLLSPLQNTALLLHRASEATGGYVKLLPQCHYCPVLIDAHDKAVPLFEFVEVLDGIIDYDQIKEELPSLSYAQIHGSMLFLRKVAQFNAL